MIPTCFFSSPDWDFPVFKTLANNDTGSAKGHQGGVVIPKELTRYFPSLAAKVSSTNPTVDTRIQAELFIENNYISSVSTRYQLQTWGGTRSAEYRLTDKLGAIRNKATAGDILVIQRDINQIDRYKLTLVRRSSAEFSNLYPLTSVRRWGILDKTKIPVSDTDISDAEQDFADNESSTFSLFDSGASISLSQVQKVARSIAFRKKILELYDEKCAVCSNSFKTPKGLIELDAAHIVPRGMMGADDSRNGFALCKRHHWAFDKGLFGIGDDRKVIVPSVVSSMPENHELAKLNGNFITEAKDKNLKVDPKAFKWHRDNLLIS